MFVRYGLLETRPPERLFMASIPLAEALVGTYSSRPNSKLPIQFGSNDSDLRIGRVVLERAKAAPETP